MEETGGNAEKGYPGGKSFQSIAVFESTSDLPVSTQTAHQRRANTIIEKSSFQGANVSSTIKKQENNFYNYYLHQCDQTNTKSTERSIGLEAGSFSPALQTGLQADHPSNQFNSNHRKPSHEFDNENYTKLSQNIYFYNLQPLRKRSRVYLGKQKHASGKWREVAVKLVPHTEQNHQEIDILLNLGGHSNIVKIIESQEIFGHIREIYIAMELCSQNLREYISSVKNRRVNFDIHASYAKQLINGLAYIHSNKIIHGDLKPDNILFSQDMKYIKISDFGLSEEALDEDDPESRRSSLPGTEGFRAPEVYLDPPKLTFASDTFSIAIVIFYLMTLGCHPFGDKPHDWGFNIRYSRNRDLARLYRLPIQLSAKLSLFGLIESSLREDASRRPTSKAMLLHKFFEGIPCEIHALDADELPAVSPLLQNVSETADRPGKEDELPNQPVNGQASFGKFSRSRQYTSFTSTVSSQSSLHNRSHLSSEASIHQRLDELEVQFDSLKRLLDSNDGAVFNSYPRSANLQYQSDFSPDEVSRPEGEARCSTTSRVPSPKRTLLTSNSIQLSSHRAKPLRRQASMKVKSSLKSDTEKAAFKRSDSFSYDRFQRSTLSSTNHDSAQESEFSSPALPDKTPKKQSKIAKWRKIFKKKEK